MEGVGLTLEEDLQAQDAKFNGIEILLIKRTKVTLKNLQDQCICLSDSCITKLTTYINTLVDYNT